MAYGIVSSQTTTQATGVVYLADVTDAAATAASKQVSLTWSDPGHVEFNGASLARWDKTLVVRKVGSAPADHTDGTVVITNTVKDQYKTTPFVDTGLTNGTTYYYRFFPVSKDGVYTDSEVVSARPAAATVAIPTVTSTHTYNTSEQTPTISGFDDTKMIKSGDTAKTNAGDYNLVFTLISEDYIWSNGQYTPQSVPWSIAKAAGGLSVSSATVELNLKVISSTVTITQVGDGELSVANSDDTVVSAVISGTTLTISRVGTNVGSATITINAAASTNYTAAQVTVAVNANNYRIMTVTIDESNSNPATCCTYADDAVDMEPGSDEWDEFFGHYPCLLGNGTGVEVARLNPNNFNQDLDGNTVTINGGSNDVMIAFPRHGLKMSKSGNIVTISMTDNPDDPDFEYMAHKRGDTLKDKFYIGAYMGYVDSNKLRSWSGKQPLGSKKHGEFETYAKANGASDGNGGSGYNQHGWYQLTYIIAMYVLKYKNLDSQSTIGNGVSYTSSDYQYSYHGINTGGTEDKGMDWGTTDNKTTHMKLFGIEDLWGNLWSWIGGFWYDANRKIWTATQSFNDTGSGYTDRGASGATADIGWSFSTKIVGTTHGGFLTLSTSGGSATTYYCDHCQLYASRLLQFGGGWDCDSKAGVFCLLAYYSASSVYTIIGSRLMYL